MHIYELYSFIDLSYKLHIYTRAVLCGATYRGTVKLRISYIRLFDKLLLMYAKIIKFDENI